MFYNFTFEPLMKIREYKANAIVDLQIKHLDNLDLLQKEAKIK